MPKSGERPTKKANIAHSINANRLKGSPRPDNQKSKDIAKAKIPSVKAKGKEKALATNEEESLPGSFKIIAGSYEKLLYGLEGTIIQDVDEEYKFNLKPIFIFPAHVSCIKAVAASPMGGKWLATGSADEIVKVWDLRRKKEIGGLMHHEGNVSYPVPPIPPPFNPVNP